jgi:DNA-binding SARP family transcriptional activator/tetratricopeptide (TPR) repeat protein/TolB-like protein
VSVIEIRALGTLELRGPGEETDPAAILSRPKRAAILAYLACARPYGPRRRDELIGMFWPDLEQENAGRALNQSVYVLRSVIGEESVRTRGSEVALDAELVWIDAAAFDAALRVGDRRTAIELHRGEFLQGFYLSGSRNFERWLDGEREHYRRRATDAAVKLSAEEEAVGNLAEATRWVRRAIESSPFEETLLRRLLALLADQGDHASAGRELDRFSSRLRDELGVEVSAETRGLARELVPDTRPAHRTDVPPEGTRTSPDGELARPESREPRPAARRRYDRSEGREPATAPRRRTGALKKFAIAALATVALVAVGAEARTWFDGSSEDAVARSRVFVTPFENRSDERSLDRVGRIAADWISRGLIETGLVEVILAPPPAPDRDPLSWAEVGASEGADFVVAGSLQRDGVDVVLTASVIDADDGTILRSLDPVATRESAPLMGIEQLRRRTAGALATVVDPRMADWADISSQPPSFESYRVYAEAVELLEHEQYVEAGDRFREAAARDSTFTSALVWAMEAYSLTGQGPRDSLALALEPRRDRLATWDRAMLDHHLANIRGDLRGEYEALRDLVRLSPMAPWQVLLARQALWLNRPGEALRLLEEVEPRNVRGIPQRMYWSLGLESLHMLGDYDRELDRVRRWRAAAPDVPWYAEAAELRALAALGRPASVLGRLDDGPWFRTWNWQEADRLRRIALELRVHGHPEASENVLRRVFALYEAAPDSVRRDPEARRQLGRSLFTAGRWAESREVFERLLDEGHEPLVARGDLALAAARLGDRPRAEEIERQYAEWASETPRQNGWATQWRARIVALLGDRDRAVRLILQAHEEGWPHWSWDELVEEYDGLRGDPSFEAAMSPRG